MKEANTNVLIPSTSRFAIPLHSLLPEPEVAKVHLSLCSGEYPANLPLTALDFFFSEESVASTTLNPCGSGSLWAHITFRIFSYNFNNICDFLNIIYQYFKKILALSLITVVWGTSKI